MVGKSSVFNKRILVTGGTGSFGSLFVKRILDFGPKEIIVFSRDEDKQGVMRNQYKDEEKLRFVLGDVRDARSVHEAMRGVDIVIHAAALKWIDMVERNVWEGIKTNVMGAQNLIEAAKDFGVQKVVALSTDKATEPINAYGMGKALQERLFTSANLYSTGAKTIFINTRYGNVLGSRGSVVPYFKSLLEKGKPLTVTDPTMTRFIMTLDESVDLVLKALEEGRGGEVFVKKMPAHLLQDLADVMVESVPKSKKQKVIITGIRPGERKHEILVTKSESYRTVIRKNYFIVLPQIATEEVEQHYKKDKKLKDDYEYTSDNTTRLSKIQLKNILKENGWV